MSTPTDLFAGGGRVGALMRTRDWSRSPLGEPSTWAPPLRTTVDLLLQSQFPMFVAWGPHLGFLYNDAYAEILGGKHPDAIGRPFRDIWSEIWSDISPLIDAAMAGESTYREDLPLVMNRTGYDEQTWFTFSYSPVRDDDGTVTGMFCAVCETTQRVLAERALRDLNDTLERRVAEAVAERSLLANIVEATGAFVQVADLEYRWLAINRAAADEFERIFGTRPRVGVSMLDLLERQPQHQAAIRAVWSRALAGEEFTEIAEFGDPSRARGAYEMRFNTLRDRAGNRIGAYQFVYDVTERLRDQERLRSAEEALRQAQKLESLGQLTGGIAHDFNNLLAVFANAVHLMERTGQAATPRMLGAMRRAVARGTGLTRQLLAFSRRSPVNPQSIDVGAHLTGMRTMLDGALGGDIDIRMQLAPDLWPVEVDPGELELAIINLCVNARDAMPAGGIITIDADNVHENDETGCGRDVVKVAVADEGIGMAPEVQARVFEPFFTTKDVGKGSGLGMPQVYGFAQQSGGRVSIQTQVGTGTTVTLVLPRSMKEPSALDDAGPASSAVPIALARTAQSRRGQVLLVEDDEEVSALTRELLASLGFSAIQVASAEAALGALANNRRIDVVLSDVMMAGGVSGIQLAREIRARRPDLPVLLTTGYVESLADVKDSEFAVLLKPYTVEALADALGLDRRLD
jgi:signal transduction histidine kinase